VILAVAATPLLFLSGLVGELARPLAVSYLVALLAALLVALILTPALALLLLGRAPLHRPESARSGWIRRGYDALAARVLVRPGRVLIGAGVVLLAALAALPQLPSRSFPARPPGPEPAAALGGRARYGAAGAGADHRTGRQRAAQGAGGTRRRRARRPGHYGDQIVGANDAELWITIAPTADYDTTVAGIKEVINGYPGFAADLRGYPAQRLHDVQAGTADDLVVRVFGEDLDVLRTKAEQVRQLLAGTRGVSTPKVDLPAVEPTVEIEVDLAAAQKVGSSRVTSAGPPRSCSPVCSSATSSRTRRSSTWWSGAHPPPGRA